MFDNYTHVQANVLYSEVNIPGPGCNIEDFQAQFTQGCNCSPGACKPGDVPLCECIERYGPNYSSNCLLLAFDKPVVECNSECACYGGTAETMDSRPMAGEMDTDSSATSRPKNRETSVEGSSWNSPEAVGDVVVGPKCCHNRVVQSGPRLGLEIFVTEAKGYGLRSSVAIPKGSFICEYAGEIIGLDEAKLRCDRNIDNMNYIFVLKEHIGDTKTIKTCVDPTKIGNIGRYINHSCRPNTAIVPLRVDNPVPKLSIFSLCDIGVGEEITFDYGGGEEDSGRIIDTIVSKKCLCGASSCKTVLPFDKDLL